MLHATFSVPLRALTALRSSPGVLRASARKSNPAPSATCWPPSPVAAKGLLFAESPQWLRQVFRKLHAWLVNAERENGLSTILLQPKSRRIAVGPQVASSQWLA